MKPLIELAPAPSGDVEKHNTLHKRKQLTGTVLKEYREATDEVFADENSTEHSYRLSLEKLFEAIAEVDVVARNEPKRRNGNAPDFTIKPKGSNEQIIGVVEHKKVGVSLDKEDNQKQIQRYLKDYPSLLHTDGLQFRLYVNKKLLQTVSYGHVTGSSIQWELS